MKRYEQLDISGDVGLRVRGKTLEELFENAAAGMSELITDASRTKETEKKEVVLSSDNNENLLIQWLNELIFLFDTYGFIGKRFNLSLQRPDNVGAAAENRNSYPIRLEAKVSGGIFDPKINESRLLIKAATYYGLSLKKTDAGWEATVVFDI